MHEVMDRELLERHGGRRERPRGIPGDADGALAERERYRHEDDAEVFRTRHMRQDTDAEVSRDK